MFRLFSAQTGGAKLWEETRTLVIGGGLFNETLGPFDSNLFAGRPEVWLEIQVGMDAPLPRRPITSVGYAFVAERAEEAKSLAGVLPVTHGGTGSAV